MQWASSMQTRGRGSMGASADSRLGLHMRSGATYSTLMQPSCNQSIPLFVTYFLTSMNNVANPQHWHLSSQKGRSSHVFAH